MSDHDPPTSEDESDLQIQDVSSKSRRKICGKECPSFSLKRHPKLKTALGHFILLVALIFYTAFGAKVFQWLEQPNELEKAKEVQERLLLSREQLFTYWSSSKEELWSDGNVTDEIRLKLAQYEEMVAEAVSAGVPRHNGAKPTQWTYTQSVFFASTVLTTIGYGNIAPATTSGRVFCIFFAFIGIPFTLTVIADLGGVMASSVSVVYKKIKQRSQAATPSSVHSSPFHRFRRKYGKTFSALAAITLLMVYLAIGAGIFMIWEDWNFLEAFYFCFITMTTIGFGDLVPAQTTYMLVCTFYILIGLALTSTIIELIRRQYAESWQRMRELTNKLHGLTGPLAETLRRLGEHRGGEPIDPALLRELVDLKKALNAVRSEIGPVNPSSVDFEDELFVTKRNGGTYIPRSRDVEDEETSLGFNDAESEGFPMEWEENWEDFWFKIESGEKTPYSIMKILSETSIKC